MTRVEALEEKVREIERNLAKAEKICAVLRDRVERSVASAGSGFTVFERNILLEQLVSERTEELRAANKKLLEEIVERERREEELREKEAQYRGVFHAVSDGLLITDLTGKIVEANPAACAMHGYSYEEMMARSAADLVPPEGRPLFEWFRREVRARGFFQAEAVDVRKDGTLFSVEIRGSQFEHKGRQHLLGIFRDVSARREAEEAVRESEGKFRNLFELSPQAIGVTEAETGILLEVNNEFCRLTKYAREELLGRSTTAVGLYAMADRKRFLAELQQSGEVRGLEMDFTLKDKSAVSALMFSRFIEISGRKLILSILVDITAQKHLQSELQQAQKMQAIGTLAGGIAHDFNNLLMGIQGNTSLLLLNKSPEHPDFARLQGIEKMVDRGADLTRQLLGFARGGKYEVKATNLNDLVRQSAEMFGRARKEIVIHHRYEEALWPVEIDRGQIEQVLLNLYVNAWQAMSKGGELFLETANVPVDASAGSASEVPPGKYVQVTVTDTGAGMDAAVRERIFEPFFTTKEMGRGTGLGLAFAYGTMKNHGGGICVTSEKGKGATFTLLFPAVEKQVPGERKRVRRVARGKATVLLVDDEEMVVEVAEKMLQAMGYKVLVARSGSEAVDMLDRHKAQVDAVVLDMVMPGQDGEETFLQLKRLHPTVKILLSTGYSLEGQAAEIMERGCDGFIQKPFRMGQLGEKLAEILGA